MPRDTPNTKTKQNQRFYRATAAKNGGKEGKGMGILIHSQPPKPQCANLYCSRRVERHDEGAYCNACARAYHKGMERGLQSIKQAISEWQKTQR